MSFLITSSSSFFDSLFKGFIINYSKTNFLLAICKILSSTVWRLTSLNTLILSFCLIINILKYFYVNYNLTVYYIYINNSLFYVNMKIIYYPIRWALLIAYKSLNGLKSLSTKIIVLADVRLIPNPPALVDSKNSLQF